MHMRLEEAVKNVFAVKELSALGTGFGSDHCRLCFRGELLHFLCGEIS